LDNLLNFAIEAHGGMHSWNGFQSISAKASIGGALWDLEQLPGLFGNTKVDMKLRSQDVVTYLIDRNERIVFTPNQISLESESGGVLETRTNPRAAFSKQPANAKWDKLDAGYFVSYALWGYLTTPFLYTYPGFVVREVEPWSENGERWRVLEVTFPDGYAAHTKTQYVYFGPDGLVRRHLHCRYFRRVARNKLCLRLSSGGWSDDSDAAAHHLIQRST